MADDLTASEGTENDAWNIKTRWADITGLGKEAETLLRVICEQKPEKYSPQYSSPPRWRLTYLYNKFLRSQMSQDDLRRAMSELHTKNILHLAFSYHAISPQDIRTMGIYKKPKALHQAIREKDGMHKINESRIEIYLVLPEDDAVIT